MSYFFLRPPRKRTIRLCTHAEYGWRHWIFSSTFVHVCCSYRRRRSEVKNCRGSLSTDADSLGATCYSSCTIVVLNYRSLPSLAIVTFYLVDPHLAVDIIALQCELSNFENMLSAYRSQTLNLGHISAFYFCGDCSYLFILQPYI